MTIGDKHITPAGRLARRLADLIEAWRALASARPDPADGGAGRQDDNVFNLFGIGADEVRHSAFLAWLFDPAASHGQGARFFAAFLGAAQPPVALALPVPIRCRWS
jgi:hypothetical protein